jgi:hypothetical protein
MSVVQLEPWELGWAKHVALQRTEANLRKHDAAHYDSSKLEDDRTADFAGAVCELATAKLLNRYWSGSYWPADQHDRYQEHPDVGRNIEVRRIRNPTYRLQIDERDVDRERCMVLAYAVPPDYTTVHVIGWGWAKHLYPLGRPLDWNPDGSRRLVDQAHLKKL